MCLINCTTEKKKNKHITKDERILIEHLYNVQKKSPEEIGDEIGKHRTTVSRELKRGKVTNLTSDYEEIEVYSAVVAQEDYKIKGSAKGPMIKIADDHELAKFIETRIKENMFSPEVIANEINTKSEFKIKICTNTIYGYIDKGILLVTRKDLTYGNYVKKAKNKKKENVVRQHNKEGRRLHDRPAEVETREILGHWEMDLVIGKREGKEPVLLVLSERASRDEIIRLLKDKTQKSVAKALDKIERKIGVVKFRETFKTITTDNGPEFLDYKSIEKSYSGVKTPRTNQYYADAYCSWQRGTNENINKMIRRFLPKGTSFKNLTNEQVARIEIWINNYPRKIHGFKTSKQVYEEMKRAS